MMSDDENIISYLNALDKYKEVQEKVSQHLKSGFLDLARANFEKSGVRYGRDLYDDRIKAIVEVEANGEGIRLVSKGDRPDPIKMFGILTPQPLRDSQREFKQALEGMVELVGALEQVKNYEFRISQPAKPKNIPQSDQSKIETSGDPPQDDHKSANTQGSVDNPESAKEGGTE